MTFLEWVFTLPSCVENYCESWLPVYFKLSIYAVCMPKPTDFQLLSSSAFHNQCTCANKENNHWYIDSPLCYVIWFWGQHTKHIHVSDNTQEKAQSRSTALPRHQKKEGWGTNKNRANATYESAGAHTKNLNRRTTLERLVGKLLRVFRVCGGERWGRGRGRWDGFNLTSLFKNRLSENRYIREC